MGENIELLGVKDPLARLRYAEAAIAQGWSRAVLAIQIDTRLHDRQGQAVTNFAQALPPETSDLAQQILKDPYQFDFLTLDTPPKERDVERALVGRVRDLLLELGKGFSFIGSQHHLEVAGQDFYVDLLFYHRRLRCLVAVDLKTGAFQPEHAGKMNFYLTALDQQSREPGENPSIGLILCRERNRLVVEYALRNIEAPIRVARYQLLGRGGASGGARRRASDLRRALPPHARPRGGRCLRSDALRAPGQPEASCRRRGSSARPIASAWEIRGCCARPSKPPPPSPCLTTLRMAIRCRPPSFIGRGSTQCGVSRRGADRRVASRRHARRVADPPRR